MDASRLARIVAIIFAVLALIFFVLGGPWVGCLVVAVVAAIIALLVGGPGVRL